MRPCFTFITASANKPPTLSIFEDIGFWGVQAKDFMTALAAVEGPALDVEISSPGGDVFAAVAMYNGLRASGKEITTRVMGVAASAASLIFMAGDKRVMPKNTHLMVHNPSAWEGGNADAHREAADMLDKIGATVRSTYVARSGMKDEDMAALLAKDTWLTADESLANGLATEVTEEVRATASFDMDRADLPEAVRAVYMAAKKTVAKDAPPAADLLDDPLDLAGPQSAFADTVLASAKAAGFEAHAPLWALACTTAAEIGERITNAREITALCTVTGRPTAAHALIVANKSVADARAALTETLAQADADTHVDTAQDIQKTQTTRMSAKPKVDSASVWASHNAQKRNK